MKAHDRQSVLVNTASFLTTRKGYTYQGPGTLVSGVEMNDIVHARTAATGP